MTFLGLVRNHNVGRRVQLSRIRSVRAAGAEGVRADRRRSSRQRWPGVRLALHHRIGRLEIGEASVAIVAASPHRGDAFAACRYAIERVKQIAPVWKREFFDGGDVWIEGATADPDDAGRARRSRADRMRVTVRLFARLRDIAGAAELARDVAAGRDDRRRCGGSWPASFPASPPTSGRSRARVNADYARMDAECTTATRSRFCRRCRGMS